MFIDLAVLFFLEGLMICIVETQYWDPEGWREVYPRAYKLHKVCCVVLCCVAPVTVTVPCPDDSLLSSSLSLPQLLSKPDNIKRFIIGRQFCTVLTGFLLAQIFTLDHMENDWGWHPALFYGTLGGWELGAVGCGRCASSDLTYSTPSFLPSFLLPSLSPRSVVVKSGLVGVMIVLAHGQLLPELLAAEYPLKFMDMYG